MTISARYDEKEILLVAQKQPDDEKLLKSEIRKPIKLSQKNPSNTQIKKLKCFKPFNNFKLDN
jgi:hypothetical protein